MGFASDALDLLEDGSPTNLVVTLETSEALTEEVSVQIRDRESGSADSGVDYVAFNSQTLIFAVGTEDGATRAVAIAGMADSLVEGTETIVIELFGASGGKISTGSAVVSINDDDVPGELEISSNPGTGAEPLADGEQIDFGTQNIGAGPTSEVVVTVVNEGDSIVTLSAVTLLPESSGTEHDKEFSVTIDTEPTGDEVGMAGLPAPTARRASPLFALGPEGDDGLRLVLVEGQLAEFAELDAVQLDGLALPGIGEVNLDLSRVREPWSADARVHVNGQPHESVETLIAGMSTWRGSVVGQPDSRVFLSLSSLGSRGWIQYSKAPEDFFYLSAETTPSTTPGGAESRIARLDQLSPGGLEQLGEFCQGVRRVPNSAPAQLELPERSEMTAPSLLPATCRVAFDSDFQFWDRFGNTAAATVYVSQLVAAINEQYTEDVQTSFESVYVNFNVDGADMDPWEASDNPGTMDANDLLDEFEQQWSVLNGAPAAPVGLDFDIAHFLSAAPLGGGIAYVDVLCNANFGLGVSTEMTGGIDFNSFTGVPDNMNWDFIVVAHEIGHNFGAEHTHDYCPPLDTCQSPTSAECPDAVACGDGTIMSYCHLCPGATTNIDLEFHPVIADLMREAVNSSCLSRSRLPGGGEVSFRISFDPGSTGEKEALLRFTHDASNLSSPFVVDLVGNGE